MNDIPGASTDSKMQLPTCKGHYRPEDGQRDTQHSGHIYAKRRLSRPDVSDLRLGLLTSTAAVALALAVPDPARAQTIVPPSAGPCVVSGATVTCTGNVSAGVAATGPTINTLNINTLSQAIAPAAGVDGISFTSTSGMTINADVAPFGITASGAGDGIEADLNGSGDVSVTSNGTIQSANDDGIDVRVSTNGNITVNHTGDITAGDAGIDIANDGNGNVSITFAGTISSGDEGLYAYTDNGIASITSVGNISTNDDGIYGYADDGAVVISSTGNVSGSMLGFDSGIVAVLEDIGDATIISRGNVSGVRGIRSYLGERGNAVIDSVGDITALNEGIFSRGAIRSADATVSVTVRSDGTITSGGVGIYGEVEYYGAIALTSKGAINASTDGIRAYLGQRGGDGNITIVSDGPITAGTGEGIDARVFRNGNIDVTSSGRIQSTTSDGIDADVSTDGNVTVMHTGDINAGDNGIEADVGRDGNISIISRGNITGSDNALYAATARNGNVTVDTVGNLVSGDVGITSYVDGSGNVTVRSVGNITSGGTAVYAYVAGTGDLLVHSEGDINANFRGIRARIDGNGNITVESTGTITSSVAEGIVVDLAGSGTVSITQTGNVTATDTNEEAIFVDNGGVNLLTSTVTINSGSTITGGTGTGVGVRFQDGATNRLINRGHIRSLAGNAVLGTTGQEQIYNFGTLTGTVNLGTNDDLVVLDATGTITSATFDGGPDTDTLRLNSATAVSNTIDGSQIANFEILEKSGASIWTLTGTATFAQSAEILGGTLAITGTVVTPVFTNTSGRLNAGGVQTVGTAAVTGTFVQAAGGLFEVEVDPTAGTADRLNVTGTANVSGLVQATVLNPALGPQSVTILSAAGGTTNNGLGLLASPALQASLSFPNANDVVLSYEIDFSAGGLNPNQTALAGSLNSTVAAGVGGLEPVLLPLLNNIFTVGDYRNALNQLLPEVVLNAETATLFASEDFVDNLFSCRLAGQNQTALSEGECYWARPQGRFLDRDSDTNTIGFDETSGGLAAGAQVAVAPNWFAGFALGYERASLDTDTGAEMDSNRFSGGLSLKYQAGSFLLGAAISGGVSGNDTQRPIGFGGFTATAESNYAIKTLTGQARAAYVFQFRDWFAKPLVDVTATYLSRDGVTETGAGAANLALAGSDDTFFSVTPALEIGGDFTLSETAVIRPYVRAGVSYYTDSDHGLTASFVNAPAGTSAFSINSSFDDVFADVAAGATAFFDNGSSLGLAYEGLISSDTQQHGISVKGTWRF